MGRGYLLFFVFPFLLFSIAKSGDQLAELLAQLVDTDAEGLNYLVEIFPAGEIDFSKLTKSDLDKLFFLSDQVKQHLLKRRVRFKNLDDLAEIGASEAEIALLKLCQKEANFEIPDIKYYGRLKISEELNAGVKDGSWAGQRFAQWQKFRVQSGSVSFGLSIHKDAGESSQFDSYNGYVAYDNAHLSLGVGSFYSSFGTGLIHSTPHFGNYKQIVSQGSRNGFRSYNGADENWPHIGFYGKFSLSNIELGISAAKQLMDGDINDGVSRIALSGYHRTMSEIKKMNQLDLTHMSAFLMLKSPMLNIGTILSNFNSPSLLTYQGTIWKGNSLYHSIFAELPDFQCKFEVKTYPGFSFNFFKMLKINQDIIDFKAYFYDEKANLNSRHFVFNRLPLNNRGINLKWENRHFMNGQTKMSGYLLWEERTGTREKILYFGFSFDIGKNYSHQLNMNNFSIKSQKDIPVHRWLFTYSYRIDYHKLGSIRLKVGLGGEHSKIESSSRYFLLRYKKRLFSNFKLILNFAGWNCSDGSQAWFYTDGLPESFSVLSATGTGTLLYIQGNFNTRNFSFYYALNKQNKWGEELLGSGSSQSQGPYRSIHYLGMKFHF